MVEFRKIMTPQRAYDLEFVERTLSGNLYRVTNGHPHEYVLADDDGTMSLLTKTASGYRWKHAIVEAPHSSTPGISSGPQFNPTLERVDLPRGYRATSSHFDNEYFIRDNVGREIGYVRGRGELDALRNALEKNVALPMRHFTRMK